MLFGLPQSLSADCRMMRPDATTIDYFDLQLYYPQHVVRLHANLYSPEPNVRYQVLGSLGKYVKYGLDPQEDRLKPESVLLTLSGRRKCLNNMASCITQRGVKTSSLSLVAISTILHKWLRQSEMVHPIP